MYNTVLVTGVSGFLGWNVARKAALSYRVVGTFLHHEIGDNSFESRRLDICNKSETKALIGEINPAFIIHCAAASKPNFCQENPQDSLHINVDGTQNIVDAADEIGAKVIFTSTDLVFDGLKGNYAEDDETNPICIYGEHKLQAEKILLKEAEKHVVCRMPLMFGRTHENGGQSFLQTVLSNLKAGKSVNLFTDEIRSCLSADDAAHGLIWAANHARGLVHLGGPEAISRYRFGQLICKSFGFNENLLLAGKQSDIDAIAPRAADASMNNGFAMAAGFNPKKTEERLMEYSQALN